MLKRYSYAIHKKMAWVVFVPTLLWTLSGMMHPFMSHWFKTALPHDSYIPEHVEKKVMLSDVKSLLKRNNFTSFNELHLVAFHGFLFLQVIENKNVSYIDIKTGEMALDGEKHYAEHMARFITEDVESPVVVSKVDEFTSEYKDINRYLPVYKVHFQRADAMDIYVSTAESKFITFNDLKRKRFIHVFAWFHTWDFMDMFPETLKTILMVLILSVLLFTACSGLLIYGLFYRAFAAMKRAEVGEIRNRHRVLGLVFSLFVFTFAFSGAFHIWVKNKPSSLAGLELPHSFTTEELPDTSEIQLSSLQGFGLVRILNRIHIQFLAPSQTVYQYIDASTGHELKDGNYLYNNQLMEAFTRHRMGLGTFKSTNWLTEFTKEYGFVNKHLPVMCYTFSDPKATRFYIDPSCQKLTAEITQNDRYEGFTFAFLHKFHFLDSFGKNLRDGILVFFALGISVTTLLGMCLLRKKSSFKTENKQKV